MEFSDPHFQFWVQTTKYYIESAACLLQEAMESRNAEDAAWGVDLCVKYTDRAIFTMYELLCPEEAAEIGGGLL